MATIAKIETKANAQTARTPIEMIAPIAAAIRLESIGMTQQAKRLSEWADSLDTAAIEIEEAISAGEADMQKLRQLQQLLKGL